jgi:hypothetical protein
VCCESVDLGYVGVHTFQCTWSVLCAFFLPVLTLGWLRALGLQEFTRGLQPELPPTRHWQQTQHADEKKAFTWSGISSRVRSVHSLSRAGAVRHSLQSQGTELKHNADRAHNNKKKSAAISQYGQAGAHFLAVGELLEREARMTDGVEERAAKRMRAISLYESTAPLLSATANMARSSHPPMEVPCHLARTTALLRSMLLKRQSLHALRARIKSRLAALEKADTSSEDGQLLKEACAWLGSLATALSSWHSAELPPRENLAVDGRDPLDIPLTMLASIFYLETQAAIPVPSRDQN